MTRYATRTLSRWLSAGVHRYLGAEVSGNLPVASCMAFLIIPLQPAGTHAGGTGRHRTDPHDHRTDRHDSPDRSQELLLSWVRSGDLTWGEAETLLALDESTPWRHRG